MLKPHLPIQARVSAVSGPLAWRGARKTRTSKLKAKGKTVCTARAAPDVRAHGKARAQSRAAHRSEQRLASSARPAHVFSCPQRNSLGGEGLPRAPRPPRKTRRTLPELASRSLNTAHRQHEQPTEAPTQELEGLEGAARGAVSKGAVRRPQRVARGVSSKIVGPGRADAALG